MKIPKSTLRFDSSDSVVYENIESERMYALDTRTRPGMLVLPNKPKNGFKALISDRHNTWMYHPLIVHPNGSKIGGARETLICDCPGAMFICEFKNPSDGWELHQKFKLTDFF